MLRRLLVLLFAAAMLLTRGGMSESVENAAHVLVHGDSAHSAEPGTEHSHRDIEHGCAGGVHVCPCCAHLPMACAAGGDLAISFTSNEVERLTFHDEAVRGEGAPRAVYRPPLSC